MPNKFDRIIRENLQALTVSMLRRIMDLRDAEILPLPGKIHRTLEREMDTLLEVTLPDGEKYLLNIEWQTTNDPQMHYRMLLYHTIATIKYALPVKGIVIYIGKEPMNMPGAVNENGLSYVFEQINLMDADPEAFLRSDVPEEILLAVLAGKTKHEDKRPIIKQILFKLHTLLKHDKQELNRKIAQLEIFGELRDAQQIIVQEEQIMAFTYNLEKDIRYNQGLEKGIEKGLEKGETKATLERNTAFVLNLIHHTDFSVEKIAKLADVTPEFVMQLKK